MAGPRRKTTSDLITALQEKPFGFDFFRAVRLLESQFRNWPRLGKSLTPRNDPVRFKQNPSLAFAPSTLQGFEPGTDDRPPKLYVNFVGLFGPTEWWRNGSPRAEDICVERTDIGCRTDCHRRACSKWVCMDIEVARVAEAVGERLRRAGVMSETAEVGVRGA